MFDSYQIFYDVGDRQLRGVLGTAAGFGADTVFAWTPAEGTWYHLAFTFDNASKIGALYINGTQVATQNVGASFAIGYDNGSLEVGRDNDNGQWVAFFTGQVDELGLYNRALTPAEIATLGGVGRPSGLQLNGASATPTLTPTGTPTSTSTQTPTGAPTVTPTGTAVK